jgi:hypothetical protein
MTVKEFLLEYENYDHSKEHYDLMKECAELSLLNQYISNQEFMAENAEQLFSEDSSFNESYFCEKVDADTLKQLKEKASNKAGKIWGVIVAGVKKIIRAVVNFIPKLLDKLKRFSEDQKKISEYLKKNKITKAQWEKFTKSVDEFKEGYNTFSNFDVPAEKRYSVKFEEDVPDNFKDYSRYLYFLLETSHINVNVNDIDINDIKVKDENDRSSKILDLDDALTLAAFLTKTEKISDKELKKQQKKMETMLNGVAKHGLKLYVNKQEIEDLQKIAISVRDSLDEIDLSDINPELTKEFNDIYKVIRFSLSANIRMYYNVLYMSSLISGTKNRFGIK